MARSAYKIGREILGELNVEQKLISGSVAGLFPDNSGTTALSVVPLNYCSQGDTDATRDGDSIKITNLFIRGTVYNVNAATTPDYHYFVRLVVYWEPGIYSTKFAFPSAIGATDGILDFTYKGNALAPFSPKDYDLDNSTEILYDKLFTLNAQTPSHEFKKLIRVHRKTQYENDSAFPATGILNMLFISNIASPTTRPGVNYLWRTYFVDN